MPNKSFNSALFRIGHNTVEWKPAELSEAYGYDITVYYNNIKFRWNARQAPSITTALRFVNLAKAEFTQQTEAAKYE